MTDHGADVFAEDWMWEHCSPELISEDHINCTLTPRRACACPIQGSHDHLIQRGWSGEKAPRPEHQPWDDSGD